MLEASAGRVSIRKCISGPESSRHHRRERRREGCVLARTPAVRRLGAVRVVPGGLAARHKVPPRSPESIRHPARRMVETLHGESIWATGVCVE